jgi:hypothetical protein
MRGVIRRIRPNELRRIEARWLLNDGCISPMNPTFRNLILICSLLCGSAHAALSVTLDWDSVSYTAGSTGAHPYDVDPTSAGPDITVTVTPNGSPTFQQELVAPNPMTPAINPSFQGGLPTTQNTLCIALNLTSNTQSVTVDVSLSSAYTAGATGVSFTIFDIDFSNVSGNTYQDQLSLIRGVALDGSLVAPTITTSINNALTGTGIDQIVTGTASAVDTGAGSGNGNVTISFGNTAIRGFTFTYGSGTLFADPTYQHIGMHDFSFTPVPEMNPAWSAILSCMVAGGLVLRHRASLRK